MVHLLQQGLSVYPINPKLSHAWRQNDSVSACKSDERDGRVLAQELCVRHCSLKPLALEESDTRKLAFLCEDEQSLIQDRTRLVQGLKSTLKQYFPTALAFFSDWTTPTAWAFLKLFSTPQKLARAKKSRLYAFLRKHRIGITPTWQKRVQDRAQALDWPCDTVGEEVSEMRVRQLIARLQSLDTQLLKYRERIEQLFEQHKDAELFSSLPGAGKKIAPRLLCIFGTQRERYETADALRQLSGVAPVTYQSGKKKRVSMRRACRKKWRTTLHLFATCSKNFCAWATAFYDYRRDRVDRQALALRKLADKWLKIIFRMWQSRKSYNDEMYTHQLRQKQSPLLAYLTVDKSVENTPQNA